MPLSNLDNQTSMPLTHTTKPVYQQADLAGTQVSIPLTDTTKRLSVVSQTLLDNEELKKDSPKSPTKKVIQSPQSPTKKIVQSPGGSRPTKIPPSPPTKPPRTYDHESPTHTPEVVMVQSPVVVAQPVGQGKRPSAIGIAKSKPAPLPTMSTFSAPGNGKGTSEEVKKLTSPTTRKQPPMSLATSTPKTVSHVSFSSMVTEIPGAMSPTSTSSQESTSSSRPKKIPPPPPPRKSSRVTAAKKNSPKTGAVSNGQPANQRPASPPTYENIENLGIKLKEEDTANKQGNSVNAKAKPETPPPKPPLQGFRPLTKYQQELAGGIYSNLNRPDLQEQKIKHEEVVRSPEHTSKLRAGGEAALLTKDGSDTDSSSSELTQFSATIRRRTPPGGSKENSPSPQQTTNKDAKKIPPPPPVRKTSALTEGQSNGGLVANGDICKLSPGLGKPDVRSLSPASLKRYEETEIY